MSIPTTGRTMLLLTLLLAVAQLQTFAQANQRTYTGDRTTLLYEGVTFFVTSIRQTDTVINGRISYTATVTFPVNEGAARLAGKLQQVSNKRSTAQISIKKADFNYKAEEENLYQDAAIREISLSALDGASKDALVLTISFAAQNMKIIPGNGVVDKQGPPKL
ncbi:MAG: hypothetical protein EOO05_12995, partial [Chitinophagaceae bacterium]